MATSAYDLAGNLTAATDPLSRTTATAYDLVNRATTTTDPLSLVATTTYDSLDHVLSTTDPLGHVTSYAYDAGGRQTAVTDAYGTGLARTSSTGYDAASQPVTSTDALSHTTTTAYDADGRVTSVTDPLTHASTTGYDAAGHVSQTADALTHATTYAYDSLGEQIEATDANGDRTGTMYDGDGRVVATADGAGDVSVTAYDPAGRAFLAVAPDLGLTYSDYDPAGNLLALTDPVDNRTAFEYDARNMQTKETDPLGGVATSAYDAAGRLTEAVDRLGREKDYHYDADDRLTQEVWKATVGGSVLDTLTYTYNDDGQVLTAHNAQGTYTFTYDALGRVSTQKDVFGYTLTYSYDATDNRTQVQDSANGTVSSTYDAAHRLTARSQSGTGVTALREEWGYDAADRVTLASRYNAATGGTLEGTTSYAYDAGDRLTGELHKNGSGTALVTYANGYDQADRITGETRNGTTVNYTYDANSQLTNDGTTTFAYDLNGNRTMAGYATGTANRLATDGTWTYTYDAEGNLTEKSKGAAAETWTYGYDSRNELSWAEDRSTPGGTLLKRIDYSYDVFGDLIEEDVTVSGVTTVTKHAYEITDASPGIAGSVNPVWADLDSGGSLTTRYLLGDGAGAPLARTGGATAWLLTDRLGSVRDITDGTGALVDAVTYDGFGGITNQSGPTYTGEWTFTGLLRDSASGLLVAHWRGYDPGTGQWLEEDPLGFGAGDASVRRYVKNISTRSTDLSGLDEVSVNSPITGGTTTFEGKSYVDEFNFKIGASLFPFPDTGDLVLPGSKVDQAVELNKKLKKTGVGVFLVSGVKVKISANLTDKALDPEKYYWNQTYKLSYITTTPFKAEDKPPLLNDYDEAKGKEIVDGDAEKYPIQEVKDREIVLTDGPGIAVVGKNFGSDETPKPEADGSYRVTRPDFSKKGDVYKQMAEHGLVVTVNFKTTLKTTAGAGKPTVVGVWRWGYSVIFKQTGDSYAPFPVFQRPTWSKD